MLFLELTQNKALPVGELIYTFIKFIIKNQRKKKTSKIADNKKMSKAIEENTKKVTVKRLGQHFSFYQKFMCTVKNNDQNKMNLPPCSFHSFPNC